MLDFIITFIVAYIPHLCFVIGMTKYCFGLLNLMKNSKTDPYSDFIQSLRRCEEYAHQVYHFKKGHSEFLNHVKKEPFTPIPYFKHRLTPEDINLLRHPFFDLHIYLKFGWSQNTEHFRTIINTPDNGLICYTTFGNSITRVSSPTPRKFNYICLHLKNTNHVLKVKPNSNDSYSYKLYLEIDKLCQTK